jgi:hypothetical protein
LEIILLMEANKTKYILNYFITYQNFQFYT